ncbi:hypothetical protein [Aureisphaera sp.]
MTDSIVYDKALSSESIVATSVLSTQINDTLEWEDLKIRMRKIYPNVNYLPSKQISPNYVFSDFTGDGLKDYAVFTRNVMDKKGYLLVLNYDGSHYKFGGGDTMDIDNFDLSWLNGISVFQKGETRETLIDKETGDILGDRKVLLHNTAISLENNDYGTVGLIYWNGKKYVYIHQVD